jgi:acyl-CoA synthetase (AMP-forming)/AMP-acid ligase II
MTSQIFADTSDFILQGRDGLQQAPPPPDGVQTLPELFAHAARQHPQRPALSCYLEGGSFQTLSYSDVTAKVGRMSDTLRTMLGAALNVAPQEDAPPVVGIWFERSLDLTLAILSATTAGSTWLPFDPDAPVDRVRVCLEDSGATLLLCDDAHYDRAYNLLQSSSQACKVVRLNDLNASSGLLLRRSSSELQRPVRAADPAYLIYTSGSE